MRLTGVLDQGDSVIAANLGKSVEISRLPVQMHRDNRFGSWGDCSSRLTHVNQSSLVAVDKDDVSAQAQRRRHGCEERVCRGDDLVAAPDAERLQPQLQSRSARGDPDTLSRAAILRENFLELGDVRAEDEGRFASCTEQSGVELVLVPLVLCAEIDERNQTRSDDCSTATASPLARESCAASRTATTH